MRKDGCMHFVVERSGSALSEAWVYVSMCCGTDKNTVVLSVLRAGIKGRSLALLGECSSC